MCVNCTALVTSQAKPFRYVLTDPPQSDILQSSPGSTCSNGFSYALRRFTHEECRPPGSQCQDRVESSMTKFRSGSRRRRGCWPRSASARVNACLSVARRSYGNCLEDPRLGSGSDRRVCPTADLWFRDEAAIDRRVRALPLATQTRELCRCCAPTLIVSPGNGRVRGSEELPRHL
jgi:hypothetical protein